MERRQQVVVDSKWRRVSSHPNPWSYVISFPETFQNVTSLDLVQAFIPNTQRTVHQFNCKFQAMASGGPTVTVDIPLGSYEPPLLLEAIQSGLSAAGLPNPALTYDPDVNIVTISCDQPFSLPFASGHFADRSIHQYLGFSNLDITDVLTVTAPFAISFPPPVFVTVAVDEIPVKKKGYALQHQVPGTYDTRPELMETPYDGLVPIDTDFQTLKFWKASSTDVLKQRFQPRDIRQFSVTVRDDKGNYYDSNGYNHALVFELTQLATPELPLMCPANNRAPGLSPWGVNCQLPFCR